MVGESRLPLGGFHEISCRVRRTAPAWNSCIRKPLADIQHIGRSIHQKETSMTSSSRVSIIRLLVFAVLGLAATSSAQTRPPIAEQIAKTYGLDSFGQVEAIRYTWNAQLPGVKLSRSGIWQPKRDQVSYEGKNKNGKPVKVTYVRSNLGGEAANVKDEIDPAFLNDQYWLLFPFSVYCVSSPHTRGGVPQSRPPPDLNRPPGDGGRQAGANFLVESFRQADGVGQVGEGA